MKSHLIKEGKKPQFLILEAGDLALTGLDIQAVSHLLGKTSPFASAETKIHDDDAWLEILYKLSQNKDQSVLESLALNPTVPHALLKQIFETHGQKEKVLQALLSNENTPPEIIERVFIEIWGKEVDYVFIERWGKENAGYSDKLSRVLTNPSTPPKIIKQVFEDIKEKMKVGRKSKGKVKTKFNEYPILAIASNPSTPPEILSELIDLIPKSYIFEEVFKNPSTPMKDIDLSSYIDPKNEMLHAVKAIASNPSTPPEDLKTLATPGGWKEYIGYIDIVLNVASNPSTDADTLEYLLNEDKYSINDKLGSNVALPPLMFERMMAEKIGLSAIASNPSTPSHILEQLAELIPEDPTKMDDPLLDLVTELVGNISLPSDLFWSIAKKVSKHTPLPSESREILLWMAMNPSTPPDLLLYIYEIVPSFDHLLAKNPATPMELLVVFFDRGSQDKGDGWLLKKLAENRRGFSDT